MKKKTILLFFVLSLILISFYYYAIRFRQQNNSAVISFYDENYKETAEILKKLVENKKNNPILNYNYAASQYKLKNYDETINIYNTLLTDNKNVNNLLKSEIYYNLGNVYFLKNDFDDCKNRKRTAFLGILTFFNFSPANAIVIWILFK